MNTQSLIGKQYKSSDNSFSQRLDTGEVSLLCGTMYDKKQTLITIIVEPFMMTVKFATTNRSQAFPFVIGVDDKGIRHICLFYLENVML